MKPRQTQTSQIKLWAIIPAAGSGSRFSKTQLKQYQTIQDKTVLEYTIDRLNTLSLEGYVLAVNEQDSVARTLNFTALEKIHFCQGGTERVHSVLNALYYLTDLASDNDYVLVHDAARPCVSAQNLKELVDYCIKKDTSAILAIPVRDTLKFATEHHIQHTVSRDYLWQAQTPQMAKLGVLREAIEKALNDKINITDEASALEHAGVVVDVVQGRSDNIKITYADDLELARLILAAQQRH
ncbi:2-C-methyl-D-erythritol 4-phosphate cytidylyltransferase [Acinetobacter sp. S40]|uniref:2-C-methyl-D-erythritol 4-phosphate cytidylyltransferase n=1 Tax=Acinetobacter sp. S40 TaxID=2767434 RepID=UPI00190AD493|nr:2-C-methyl-D-erythritol 4-phosphate cytidylyltransferase [Acinetobacter sp. S40]MBJ9985187.1 2-C-methyl-D-erythritol 4-phosphate cytidylyltransferase [Acinetobacter sp. S40]